MTLYYSIVFVLLMAEMLVFGGLIMPMPFQARRKLFTFISESKVIAKLQYGLKITFICVLILFVDSVNHVYRDQFEAQARRENASAEMSGTARMEAKIGRFYAQRNMYLCGFTLFLSLILNRTYTLILDVLRLEEEVRGLKGDPAVGGKDSEKLANAGGPGEIGRLKKELEQARKDVETMKKQHEGFQREYNRLGDEKVGGAADGSPRKDR